MSHQGARKRWCDGCVSDYEKKNKKFKKHRKIARLISDAFIVPVSDFGVKDEYKSPWMTFAIIDNLADYFMIGDRRIPRKSRKRKAIKRRRQEDKKCCKNY